MYLTIRKFVPLAAVLALAACSDEAAREQAVKEAILATQFERTEITLRDLRYYPGHVACGEYATVDKWGKETSARKFIVRDGRADTRPGKEDRQIFCDEDPAGQLRAATGIDWGSESTGRAYRDLKSLHDALQAYAEDNYLVPNPSQGLAALVADGRLANRPRNYREGGYLDEIPKDPWGRDYLYRPSVFGGVASNAEIRTLGADGVEGGTGDNADIGSRDLKYLDHLAGL